MERHRIRYGQWSIADVGNSVAIVVRLASFWKVRLVFRTLEAFNPAMAKKFSSDANRVDKKFVSDTKCMDVDDEAKPSLQQLQKKLGAWGGVRGQPHRRYHRAVFQCAYA